MKKTKGIILIAALLFVIVSAVLIRGVLYDSSGGPQGEVIAKQPGVTDIDVNQNIPDKDADIISERFLTLYEQNEDIVGWIRVPNTPIDYPVVYCNDNAYYLSHNFLKEPTKQGTPFLEMGAGILENNQSLSLFGHYLTNGTMFTALHRYKSLDYYKEYPLFEFSNIYEDGFYKIFSVFYMAGNRTDKQFYYYPVSNFKDDKAFMEHVGEIRNRSIFSTTVDVVPGDRLVLLTCCTYETDNLRLIVAGRLIRPEESIIVDTENAGLNPEPLYPQKWYNKKGGSPPVFENT